MKSLMENCKNITKKCMRGRKYLTAHALCPPYYLKLDYKGITFRVNFKI